MIVGKRLRVRLSLHETHWPMNFIEELRWRGLLYDMIPGTEAYLTKQKAKGYIGFDPTAPSLGIGNMVQIITLMHFQRAGHQPVAVIGGATGMVGDPSGKSAERNLLSEEALRANEQQVKAQLEKFLDFDSKTNPAILVNNYDWFKDINLLTFLRDTGKYLTVSYMMAKDSVKNRLDSGISFTEFSYQLLQAYDYYHLYREMDCKVQLGGSDQWGNLTAGVELIRRKAGGEAFAVTTPLVTKADGTKFGKTESGNIYLNEAMTSPYRFYQFWLNVSDEDAEKFIRIFTFLTKDDIDQLIEAHRANPHERQLQKRLAREVTELVHSTEAYQKALETSNILFGKSTRETLLKLSEQDLLDVFEGVPHHEVARDALTGGIPILDFLAEEANILQSKGEARRLIKDNGLLLNKERITDQSYMVTIDDVINGKYLLVQRGKKNYHLVVLG